MITTPQHEETLERLLTIIDYAEGLTLLFASCNVPALRRRLMDEAITRLTARGIHVVDVVFGSEVHDLRAHLREELATAVEAAATGEKYNKTHAIEADEDSTAPMPALALQERQTDYDAPSKLVLSISGLEYSIPYDDPEAPMLAELNMGRELFHQDTPHPLVIWLPDYALTALARNAPDFWAWRSGVFEFEAEPQQRQQMYEQYTQQGSDWLNIDNMGVEDKLRRRRILESLLDEYVGLPDEPSVMEQRKDIFFSLAQINQALHDLPRAIEFHQRYLEVCRTLGNRQSEGNGLGNLGNAYAALGRMEEAIDHYQQALVISREIGDRRGEGADLGNLGIAYKNLGRVKEAIDHYQQTLAISREIGDRRGEGTSLGNLGVAYATLGRMEEAIDHLQQALVIAREIGDRRGEGNHLGNLGVAYAILGRMEEAIGWFEQALPISREIGDRSGEGLRLGSLGLAYKELGNIERAHRLWQAALAIFEEIKAPIAETMRGWLAELDDDLESGIGE